MSCNTLVFTEVARGHGMELSSLWLHILEDRISNPLAIRFNMDHHQKEVAMPHPTYQGLIQCLLWTQISTILIRTPCKCDAVMHGPFRKMVWWGWLPFLSWSFKGTHAGYSHLGSLLMSLFHSVLLLLLPAQQDVFLQAITDPLLVTRMGREKEMTHLVSPRRSCHSC